MIRALAWLVGIAAAIGSAAYVFIYQVRWEWNRAVFMAVVFIAVEVALATGLVLRRLSNGSSGNAADEPGRHDEIAGSLRRSAPKRVHFAWLDPTSDRLNVFLTVLVSGGLVVSAAAWLIDRIASQTALPRMERSLAERLSDISFPTGGLVPGPDEAAGQEPPLEDRPGLRILLGPSGGDRAR